MFDGIVREVVEEIGVPADSLIISGLQNYDRGSVSSVITAADKEGWCGSIGSVEEMQAKLLKRQEAATKLGLNSLAIYIAVQVLLRCGYWLVLG